MNSEDQIRLLVEEVVDRILSARGGEQAPSHTVAVGADHRGFALKEALIPALNQQGYEVLNCGTYSEEPADYPDIAKEVGRMIQQQRARFGILIDGAGIGSSIAANKMKGIRAAFCFDRRTAENARRHNNANVLTLGAFLDKKAIVELSLLFLQTPFEGGRHQKRIEKITALELMNR